LLPAASELSPLAPPRLLLLFAAPAALPCSSVPHTLHCNAIGGLPLNVQAGHALRLEPRP
jgi:hypothetical protein